MTFVDGVGQDSGHCPTCPRGTRTSDGERHGGAVGDGDDLSEAPKECFDLGVDGEPASCMWSESGGWELVESGGGFGAPTWLVLPFVLVLLLGVAGTWWRVSAARRMATRSGLDPADATAVTLLGEHGLEATYLASTGRGASTAVPSPVPSATSPGPASSAEERLTELARLLDRGLISAVEYDERRRAVLDSL